MLNVKESLEKWIKKFLKLKIKVFFLVIFGNSRIWKLLMILWLYFDYRGEEILGFGNDY